MYVMCVHIYIHIYYILISLPLGRPYGTDQLVNIISRDPVRRSKILPFLTFMWNIVLPVAFLVSVFARITFYLEH